MALKIKGISNLFGSNPEDGEVLVFEGNRRIPETFPKSDEFIVAADGTGDFLTIEDALTKLGASSGTIRVKAGNYEITSYLSLSANQTIIGSGYGTRIHTTSDTTLISLAGNRSSIFMCRIDGNETGSSQVGIAVIGNECIIKNCWITQMGDIGINFSSGNDKTTIEGCIIEDCSDRCIELNDAQNFMISDCVIDNSSNDGIQGTGADFGSIIGCKITNHGEHGIDLNSCTQLTIVGNYIFSNGDNGNNGDGIELGVSNDCAITGNIIHTNDGVGVDISSNCNRTLVVGNSVLNNEDGQITDNGTDSVIESNST